MAHIRQRIREEVVSRLNATAELAGLVRDSYAGPIDELEPEVVNVSTPSGESEQLATGNPPRMRRGDIVLIEGIRAGDDPKLVAIALDDWALAIEQELGANFAAGNYTVAFIPQEWELELSTDEEKVIGKITFEYSAQYQLLDNNPEVP